MTTAALLRPDTLPPLVVPADMPKHAREQLALYDRSITKAVADACVSSESYRMSAENFAAEGSVWRAVEANYWAKRIELDPRLYVAGCMHNATSDGTTKHLLHIFIELLETQAKARQATRRAA